MAFINIDIVYSDNGAIFFHHMISEKEQFVKRWHPIGITRATLAGIDSHHMPLKATTTRL